MSRKKLLTTLTAIGALALAPAAHGSTLDQDTTGVAAEEIALSAPTAAAFGTVFKPGASGLASTGGTVTATSTKASWTLSAKDKVGTLGTTPGQMDAQTSTTDALSACYGSASSLANKASLAVAPAVANAGITTATISLSGADQTVASATNVLLSSAVFNTTFTQSIGSSEILKSGCTYGLTTTYTLQ